MRIIIALLSFLLVSNAGFAQSEIERTIDSLATVLKAESNIDRTDLRVFSLLDRFYDETLQADNGTLSAETVRKIQTYNSDKHLKNNHLFTLFFLYQQLVGTGEEGGPNPAVQLACINKLENEMLAVYGKVPIIVSIYKIEALQSAGQREQTIALIEESLKKFPESIPLKVYKYLHLKDEVIKADLIQNHSKHWMVLQNRIAA